MKLTQRIAQTTNTVLLFGPPKSGKSLLAGKLAEHFDLLWFDLENGVVTLLQLPEAWQERVEVINIPDTRTYPMAIETMLKVLTGKRSSICEKHGKVDCMMCKKNAGTFVTVELSALPQTTIVVIDSLTQLTNSAISNITKDKDIDYKMQTDDWGSLGKFLDMCLSQIQQAPYNVVCITHESEVEMEDGKSKLVPTAGTRNFSRNTAKYFGHVVYVEVKNKSHRAASSTTYATNLLTGSRSNISLENGELSLLRIFKPDLFPELPAPETKGNVTQAAKAGSSLAELRAKLAANKSG